MYSWSGAFCFHWGGTEYRNIIWFFLQRKEEKEKDWEANYFVVCVPLGCCHCSLPHTWSLPYYHQLHTFVTASAQQIHTHHYIAQTRIGTVRWMCSFYFYQWNQTGCAMTTQAAEYDTAQHHYGGFKMGCVILYRRNCKHVIAPNMTFHITGTSTLDGCRPTGQQIWMHALFCGQNLVSQIMQEKEQVH